MFVTPSIDVCARQSSLISSLTTSMEILCRYLMGPDMNFVKFFGKNNDVDSLTDGVIKEIKRYKK